MSDRLIKNTQNASAVVVFISFWALLVVLVAQYIFDLKPCVLCIYQRIPYVFAIALGLVSYGAARQDKGAAAVILGLITLTFLINTGISLFHVGVEQDFWAGTGGCGTGDINIAQTIDELRAQILNTAVTKCNEVAWSLFGISMAGYNAILSFSLALYSGYNIRKGFQHGRTSS